MHPRDRLPHHRHTVVPVTGGANANGQPVVRAARCDHQATDEQILETLQTITEPLSRSWERLSRARRVIIKFNMMQPDTQMISGRRQELVDEAVIRGVVRLLRQHTDASLAALDTCLHTPGHLTPADYPNTRVLAELGVEFIDANAPPHRIYEVPGSGSMFDRYLLNAAIGEADEFVSVAKMKNHSFMGVTLCMKNLFGLSPSNQPSGRVRHYFHHAIRLSYVLPDLAMITDPCLNIIDGLTGQQGSEWRGRGVIPDILVAGDQITATDAGAAHLMGVDPTSDWPTPPFRRDRNHLLVAAERGYGTVDLQQIDFATEVQPPVAEFVCDETDTPQIVHSIRRTACEQALFYQKNRDRLVSDYADQLIALREGEVVWHGTDQPTLASHGDLAGDDPGQAAWLKVVDREEAEGEVFGVYESQLARLAE